MSCSNLVMFFRASSTRDLFKVLFAISSSEEFSFFTFSSIVFIFSFITFNCCSSTYFKSSTFASRSLSAFIESIFCCRRGRVAPRKCTGTEFSSSAWQAALLIFESHSLVQRFDHSLFCYSLLSRSPIQHAVGRIDTSRDTSFL